MIDEQANRNTAPRNLTKEVDKVAAEVWRSTQVLFEPGAVAEVRAFGGKTISGYFDDFRRLARAAARLESRDFQVYATLNPVNSDLLARAKNRVFAYPEATTADTDIMKRRWLPVDLDPARQSGQSGVSSSDLEKGAAFSRAEEIKGFLAEKGWPEPIEADSGNGAHLLYRVDLPNDAGSAKLVEGVIKALDFRFSDNIVAVDTKVSNASRVWKLYGTTARKGNSTEDRPHRKSRFLRVPETTHKVTLTEVPECGR